MAQPGKNHKCILSGFTKY